MQPNVLKLVPCSGLVLAVVLSACSSGGGAGDTVDVRQTTNPEPTATDEAEGASDVETESDGEATADEPATDDGPERIGGEETGLTLEIPDEWVDIPMDVDALSGDLAGLDLPADQAAFIESSIGALGSLDGAIMAIDTGAFGASVTTNVNAYCIPNDGSFGDTNLETASELGLEMIAEGIEVESATVDGSAAARATYSLDVTGMQGNGVQYVLLADDDVCWVTFTGADESLFDLFDEMAATIDVL